METYPTDKNCLWSSGGNGRGGISQFIMKQGGTLLFMTILVINPVPHSHAYVG